jgi:hypothetical protein
VPLLDLAVEVVRKQAARSHCYCAGYAATGGLAERYQLVRLTNRKFLEHELVDQSKDGRVRSHTERQRKNCDEGEAGALRKHAQAIADVRSQ